MTKNYKKVKTKSNNRNSYKRSMRRWGIVKTIFTKKDFTLLDAGIDPKLMSAEFQSDNVGAKFDMGKIVKAGLGLSGFRAMDALMKETNLTVNYNRYKRLSKLSPNSSKFKKFRSEVEFMVGKEDADRTINDFSEDRLAEIVEKIFSNE